MNQFMKEYNDADLTNAVHHITPEERKIVFDKNNARNRCWYTEEAAANRLNLVESDFEMEKMLYASGEAEEEDFDIDTTEMIDLAD